MKESFIVILLGLFYLYNYFYNNIESFDINKCISTSLQNYYIGEPIINNIKNTLIPQGEVDVNIQMIENSTPCTYIASNNIGLYCTDNINLYYFNTVDNKWNMTAIKPTKLNASALRKPYFDITNNKCNYQTTLVASK